MLVIACVLLGVLLVPLTGGRLSRLAGVTFTDRWLLVVALVAQVVVIEVVSQAADIALARAGIEPEPGDFVNSGVVDGANLWFLGDVFAWPQPMPLANVFSVGDVLVVAGAVWGVHRVCRRGRRVRDTVDGEHIAA